MIETVLLAAVLHAQPCFWKDRHKPGCRNQAIYLVSPKRPTLPLVVQLGKGEACDKLMDRCNVTTP